MFVAIVATVGVIGATTLLGYHPLFFSPNPGLGFARLSTWVGLFFAGMTIAVFSASDIVSDPIYIFFYMIIGYAIIKGCGQLDPVYRVSYRIDVVERRSSAAGFYLGARTIAVAVIFSGSMIGEGPGFYVVLAFFGAGWLVLEVGVWILCRFRKIKIKTAIRDNQWPKIRSVCRWYIIISLILYGACAGDFKGWTDGFVDFFVKIGQGILQYFNWL